MSGAGINQAWNIEGIQCNLYFNYMSWSWNISYEFTDGEEGLTDCFKFQYFIDSTKMENKVELAKQLYGKWWLDVIINEHDL